MPILTFGQPTTVIKGLITDEASNPLPRAQVSIQSLQLSTLANDKGMYHLSIPSMDRDAEISVKAAGCQPATAIITLSPGEFEQNFMLNRNSLRLEENINIGYGTARKKTLTGPTNYLKADTFEQAPTTTFQEHLQGTPGLQVVARDGAPGANIQIRVRGISSINASSEPLYVIDGLPVTSGSVGITDFSNDGRSSNVMASLNPYDIESVVVLKDGVSTAMYGSRGANGVILITTKGGVAGSRYRTEKPRFRVNMQRGYSDFAFNNLLKSLNSEQYTTLFYEGYANSGGLTPEEAQERFDKWFPDPAKTNWVEAIRRTGVVNQVNMSARGGSEKFDYYISAGYLNQEGVNIATDFERYSSRVNLAAQVTDRLHIANHLNLSYTKQTSIPDGSTWESPIYNSVLLPPVIPVRDESGEYYFGHRNVIMSGANPVSYTEMNRRAREQTRIIDNLSATYRLTDKLLFRSAWNFDVLNVDEYIFEHRFSPPCSRCPPSSAIEARTDIINWQIIQTLDYANNFGGSHDVDWIVGYEAQKVTADVVMAMGWGFAHPELKLLASAAATTVAYSAREAYVFQSVFSRAAYRYKNKFDLSGVFRTDGSSRFGPEKRWGKFWSVGLGYTMTEEPFLRKIKCLNVLKLRGGYGVSGNADLGNYRWAGQYNFDRAYDGRSGVTTGQSQNPRLSWESQKALNLGFDFVIWNNRFSGTLDWFERTSSDLILERPVSMTTGFRHTDLNAGGMKNSGIELSLMGTLLQSEETEISLHFNIIALSNELTHLPGFNLEDPFRSEQGKSLYEFYLYGWAGVDPANGEPLWYTDETKRETTKGITGWNSDAERFFDGKSALPKAYGSFGLTGRKGPFSLTVRFTYQVGNYIYDGTGRYIHADGRYSPRSTSTWAFENRWTEPGQQALFPQWHWGGNQSSNPKNCDRYLFKGDFIRLKILRLGYRLPQTFVSKLGIASVEAYVYLRNFWTWVADDHLYVDPEQSIDGIYNATIPVSKTSSLGLSIQL